MGLFCSVLFLFLMQITFSLLKLLEICIDMDFKNCIGSETRCRGVDEKRSISQKESSIAQNHKAREELPLLSAVVAVSSAKSFGPKPLNAGEGSLTP